MGNQVISISTYSLQIKDNNRSSTHNHFNKPFFQKLNLKIPTQFLTRICGRYLQFYIQEKTRKRHFLRAREKKILDKFSRGKTASDENNDFLILKFCFVYLPSLSISLSFLCKIPSHLSFVSSHSLYLPLENLKRNVSATQWGFNLKILKSIRQIQTTQSTQVIYRSILLL